MGWFILPHIVHASIRPAVSNGCTQMQIQTNTNIFAFLLSSPVNQLDETDNYIIKDLIAI